MGLPRLEDFDGLGAIAGDTYIMSSGGQGLGKDFGNLNVVVNNQDAGHSCGQ
jgi:hypothetical protein